MWLRVFFHMIPSMWDYRTSSSNFWHKNQFWLTEQDNFIFWQTWEHKYDIKWQFITLQHLKAKIMDICSLVNIYSLLFMRCYAQQNTIEKSDTSGGQLINSEVKVHCMLSHSIINYLAKMVCNKSDVFHVYTYSTI